MSTVTFDPIKYGFRWTDDWYEYDGKPAEDAAKAARDDYAKQQRKAGRTVKKRTTGKNLRSMGGIGSGNPHIELIVPMYHVVLVD